MEMFFSWSYTIICLHIHIILLRTTPQKSFLCMKVICNCIVRRKYRERERECALYLYERERERDLHSSQSHSPPPPQTPIARFISISAQSSLLTSKIVWIWYQETEFKRCTEYSWNKVIMDSSHARSLGQDYQWNYVDVWVLGQTFLKSSVGGMTF